jgi:hypothetical protein
MQGLAAEILLRNLPLELDAVGSVLCHGPSSSESPAARSITENHPVRPEGPTPIEGQFGNDDVIAAVAPLNEDSADGKSRRPLRSRRPQ